MKTDIKGLDTTIHPLLAQRFSPRGFAESPVDMELLHALLEAARWAPSSYNEQPWRFIVARKEDGPLYDTMLATLNDRNRDWARNAPVLVLAAASMQLQRNNIPNRFSWYDTGQAMATLTLQATAMDLYVHQMGGFDPAAARDALDIPEGYEPVVMAAIGYLPVELTDEEIELKRAARSRRQLKETAYHGMWGIPLFPMNN
jgi:nitroreductase